MPHSLRSGVLRCAPQGSNSVITSDNGTFLSETRYKASPTHSVRGCYAALREGEIRYSTGTATTTPYTYIMIPEAQRSGTGQYSNTADFGWMYYKARWYDNTLGRFTQADTIVQNPSFSVSYDRYAYVMNNPVRYNDPTGNACRDDGYCVLMPGDRLPAKSKLMPIVETNSNKTFGIGFQQSIEFESFRWDLLYGGFISGGTTSSDSINTTSDIAFLLEQENGNLSGIEFDTDNVFGGYNFSEGFMLGGRTSSMATSFGLTEGSSSNRFAGSCSIDLSKGLWNSEVTISIYPTDITTLSGALEGEVMAGYYLKYSPVKNMANGVTVVTAVAAIFYVTPIAITALLTNPQIGVLQH